MKGQLPALSQVPEPFGPFNVVGRVRRVTTGHNGEDGRRAFCRFLPATSTHRYRLHLTCSRRLYIKTSEARITPWLHLAGQMFSFFFRRDGHGASSKVPVYSKPAQQSRLDGDQKALAGIALRALESACIITRCGRFDMGQSHGIAAPGARQESDFGPTVKWIGMDGWHDARLGSGGSAILSVTGKSLYGAVMENSMLFRAPQPLVNIGQFLKQIAASPMSGSRRSHSFPCGVKFPALPK